MACNWSYMSMHRQIRHYKIPPSFSKGIMRKCWSSWRNNTWPSHCCGSSNPKTRGPRLQTWQRQSWSNHRFFKNQVSPIMGSANLSPGLHSWPGLWHIVHMTALSILMCSSRSTEKRKMLSAKKKSFTWQEAHIFRKNSSYLKTEWNLNLMISLILRDIMFFFRGLCDLVEGRFTTRAWVHLRTGCLEAGGPKYLIWTRMMLLPFGWRAREASGQCTRAEKTNKQAGWPGNSVVHTQCWNFETEGRLMRYRIA